MTALARWLEMSGYASRRRRGHDNMCPYLYEPVPPTMCPGCLFAQLKGDAAYGVGRVRDCAFDALSELGSYADAARGDAA